MGSVMEERYSAHMYVDYYAKHRGISVEDIGVAPLVVLSWGQRVIQSFAEMLQAQRSSNWFYDEDHIVYPLYTARVEGHRVSFAQAPEGAPATVVMMEEMIACGAHVFLALGWAGSLQRTAPVGSMVVPTRCIDDEGTSRHYAGGQAAPAPDPQLLELLQEAADAEGVDVVRGLQWTTDAPYRELLSVVERYREQGVVSVDMETSAMYALAAFRGVKACNLLVISDELWGEWRPAFRSPELRKATTVAQRIIVRCLEEYLCRGRRD